MRTTYYKYPLPRILKLKSISSFSYQKLSKDYKYSGESHNTWEFIYVDYNNVLISIENELTEVRQNEIIFIEPNHFHNLSCDGIHDANIFVISFSIESELPLFEKRITVLNKEQIHILQQIINIGTEIFIQRPELMYTTKLLSKYNKFQGAEQLLRNYLEIFFLSLYKENSTPSVLFLPKKIEEANICDCLLEVLQNNLYSKLTLDDIVSILNYSKSLLCKKFKEQFGVSIMQHYLRLKIDESKKLLSKSISLTDIADSLNFCSVSHFINTFKKYEGFSPMQYVKLLPSLAHNT